MKISRNLMRIVLSGFLIAFASSANAQRNTPDSQMVNVPAGAFTMGCIPQLDPVCQFAPDEYQHQVFVSAFKIDKFEVTFRRYQKCIDDNVCTIPAVGGAMNYGWPGVERFPVNGVTWRQADAFCKWEGKRLPTEAEWEKAARGTDFRTYPWGMQNPTCERTVMDRPLAGNLGCGTGSTLNVGSKPKGVSPYGAHDMAGNVWEYVSDWHDENYFYRSPYRNPKGPRWGTYKVTKGGDLYTRSGYEVRSSSRFPFGIDNYSPAIGFRCAK